MERRDFLNTLGKSVVVTGIASHTGHVLAKTPMAEPQLEVAEKSASNHKTYDRAFLEGLGERYLEALVAHDPSAVPFSEKVMFAENNQKLQPGDASWRTMDRLGRYRHYFCDPEMGLVGLIANIYENGSGGILVLRLKVENNLIVEAEQFVIHDPFGAALYEKLGKPDPVWLEPIPPDQRQSREALEAVAYM
jgi:hypothetical protein